MLLNQYNYSTVFGLSEQDTEELTNRLQVGKSIITFNAGRLSSISYNLLALHEFVRQNILLQENVALKEPNLNSKQMAIALEFYLQIDGELQLIFSFCIL